jgi:hypothetical protein
VRGAASSLTSGPKGLNTEINSGNKVKLFRRATIIATPVRRPKYREGMKLDKVRIEKPAVTVMAV